MRVGAVTAGEIAVNAFRLTGSFHLSEDHEAMRSLGRVKTTSRLGALTKGRGVFRGPMFARRIVSDPSLGRPYVSAKDLVQTTIRPASYISLSHGNLLDELELRERMVLVTRSGMNLGQAIWVRADMAGLCASDDLIRIEVDEDHISPGYLYSFLASKHGRVSIRRQIYGGSIKHVEPQHVAGLPVPRFGPTLERHVQALVEKASTLRVESSRLLEGAKNDAATAWGIEPALRTRAWAHPDICIVPGSVLSQAMRLDAFFFGSAASASDQMIANISRRLPIKRIGDAEVTLEVFEPSRFGRISVEDARFGVPLLSISDMMRGSPKAESFISRKQAIGVRAIVEGGWLVLPRVGQLQGVFGSVSYVARHLGGVAVSDNNVRIVPVDEDEGAYLWAALSTDLLYQQIVRRACGTSIPYIDAKRVANIPVPWPAREQRLSIAEGVKQAMEMRSRASKCEADAVKEVERAIEDAS